MMRFVLALLVVASALPSIAKADTAAVIGTTQAPQIPEAIRTEAIDAVSRALATDGVAVMSARDAQLRMLGDPAQSCTEVTCADQIARHLGVDFVALVTVWARRDQSTPSSVTVTLVNAESHSFGGEGDVEHLGSILDAADAAVFEARQRQSAGTLGFLRVRSTPSGASVESDGETLGQTPFFRGIAPGHHRVVVRRDGYAAEQRDIDVALHQETAVDVTLTEGNSGAPTPAEAADAARVVNAEHRESRVSPWNYVIAGGLAVAAVPMLVSSLSTLATNGDVLDDGSQVHFGAQSGVLLGLGIAALGTATYFLLAHPLQYDLMVTNTGATFGVRGSF